MDRRNVELRIDTGEETESDAELVARAIAGSEGAFSVLVGRYNDLLYRHAFRMLGEADDAEDAVQTAWIKAYRSLSRCRDRDRFGSWVFRISANVCKDLVKGRRKGSVSLEAVAEVESPDGGADAAVRWDQRRRLNRALAGRQPASVPPIAPSAAWRRISVRLSCLSTRKAGPTRRWRRSSACRCRRSR